MCRLTIPTRDDAPKASTPLLDMVYERFGRVPNLFRLIACSPSVLAGYLGFEDALSETLDAKTRVRIALAVAQVDGCDYSLSAHSYLGLNFAKIGPDEIALNREGRSADEQADAAVRFAARVARERGNVSDEDVVAVRSAGFSDAQIVEIVALVALNGFTNYLNEVARTEVDFPLVRAAEGV